MMTYGIGRVPADVDPVNEAMAELAAAQINAQQLTDWETHLLGRWHCVACDSKRPNLRIWRSATPGAGIWCEGHWLSYHQKSGHGETVDDVINYFENLAAREYKCARCGTAVRALWNSGAGEALCDRHWDSY